MTGTDPTPRFAAVTAAEVLGTFVVTAVFVGTSVIGATLIGPLGTALATGFAVLAVVAVFGRVSGAHVNPAVTIGLAVAGRFPWRDVPTHIVAQLVGAVLGAAVVLAILADGPPGAVADAQRAGFAAGGYGLGSSPGGFGLVAVGLVGAFGAAVLVAVYGAVADRATRTTPARQKPVAAPVIGATVVAICVLTLPVSNAAIDPARSLATALFAGPDRLSQAWAFVVFPVLGAIVAALAMRWASRRDSTVEGIETD